MSHEQETEGMKPYPEYKRSGAEGLPNVPQPWEIGALKRVANFKSGAGFPVSEQGLTGSELPFFKVSDMNLPGNEGTLRTWNNSISRGTADELGAYIFPAGSIVFPKVGGALLTNKRRLTERPSCIDNNLMGCTVKQANQDFMFRVLGHIDLGNIAKPGPVPAISEREVQEIRAAFPPLKEQATIARFLDHADEQIQRYIAGKERLIALLEEERQALVHQAVTRGLDPNVRLKPSGVEWLGDVPEHWELRRIRNLGQAIIGLTYSPQDIVNKDEGKLVLRASNISGGGIVDADNVYVRSPVPDKLVLREGDILICSRSGSRNLIGKNARIESTMLGATFGAFMTILRGRNNDYLHQVFNSKLFEYQSGAFLTSTINQLTLGILNDMKIPFPPAGEQRSILQHLKQATKTVDVTIDRARRQTALMEEYRTRLIADVVTGQLDVREAAEELPTPEPTEITD